MKETLETLEKKHTEHVNSLFMMCLEILFIFGIPAFGTLLLYKLVYSEVILLQLGLPASFFLSWGVFLLRWKSLSAKVIALEEKLREMKRVEEDKKQNNV